MAREITEYVDLGTSGDNLLVLASRGLDDALSVNADLSSVTRVVLDLGTITIDSAIVGSSVIWWTDQTDYHGTLVDCVKMRLGGQSIPVGTYSDCKLWVYDASHPNGEIWPETQQLDIIVRDYR